MKNTFIIYPMKIITRPTKDWGGRGVCLVSGLMRRTSGITITYH